VESRSSRLSIVTGAFGFSGRCITKRLVTLGERVRTLTNHAPRSAAIDVAPLDFGNPQELARSMTGASVLYNTYWVRFAYGETNHRRAVEHSRALVSAAERAGVRRIVHVSITNPSPDSPLSYFRGKAAVEDIVRSSSLSYAILRPALLFGSGDILINNIAWFLRRYPIFAIPGDGEYGVQPVFVEDLATLAIECGHKQENAVLDAVGPERYQFKDLVGLIRESIHSHCRLVFVPPFVACLTTWILGRLVNDQVLTREEISGLMANLLVSNQPPSGNTSLREWLRDNCNDVGGKYASELRRHYRRDTSRA